MSKILIYIVAAVVVVGGGYWAMTHQGQGAGMPADGTPASQAPAGETSPSSFADIMKSGADVQCDVSVDQQGGTVHGTVFVAGKGADVRGDFSMSVQGREMHSSLIKTGGYVYVWSDVMPQGFKSVAQPSEDPIAAMNSGTVPAGTHYDCRAWVADMTKFIVPANVTFTTMPGAQR